MPRTYDVMHINRDRRESTIVGVRNVFEARDEFAKEKGYRSWGHMVLSYKNSSSDYNVPPYKVVEK